MPRALALALAAVLAAPATALAEPPSGVVETDEGRIEILGRPVRVGERVDLPEGWYRVEEAGPEDHEVGSFGIVSSGAATAVAATAAATPAAEAGAPAERKAGPASCAAERGAFLAELFHGMGVEVKDPAAFLQALEGDGFAPGLTTLWLALATDPVRPLAWSSALRSRADALARCAHGG
jgi:hypothetical protein